MKIPIETFSIVELLRSFQLAIYKIESSSEMMLINLNQSLSQTALPEEVYLLWFPEYPFGEIVCKFHKFAAESFTNATVFTITAFTIER